jgi:hypothetical protein
MTGELLQRTRQNHSSDARRYRQFLDSSGNALTIIHCFTDIPANGGGTALCEDGIKRKWPRQTPRPPPVFPSAYLLADTLPDLCEQFYAHPEGIDPPFDSLNLYQHCKTECSKFAQIEAKAGDVFITHGMIPHAHTPNHLHYPRIITNPHVNLAEPFNLNRPDGDYVSTVTRIHTSDPHPGSALTPIDAV